MARPTIGSVAMTPAERKRRQRELDGTAKPDSPFGRGKVCWLTKLVDGEYWCGEAKSTVQRQFKQFAREHGYNVTPATSPDDIMIEFRKWRVSRKSQQLITTTLRNIIDDKEYMTSRHEAGHALVAAYLGYSVDSIHLGTMGMCHYSGNTTKIIEKRYYNTILTTIAGVVGEYLETATLEDTIMREIDHSSSFSLDRKEDYYRVCENLRRWHSQSPTIYEDINISVLYFIRQAVLIIDNNKCTFDNLTKLLLKHKAVAGSVLTEALLPVDGKGLYDYKTWIV